MNKPIKTLSMSLKRPDNSYLSLGNNATWDNVDYNWSIKIDSLRELLKLIDNGAIEPKRGYVGGKCKIFEKYDADRDHNKEKMQSSGFVCDNNIPF